MKICNQKGEGCSSLGIMLRLITYRLILPSVKKGGKRLFVSSYPENPSGTVLFLPSSQARLRSQVEKDYQSMRKKTNNLEDRVSNDLNF